VRPRPIPGTGRITDARYPVAVTVGSGLVSSPFVGREHALAAVDAAIRSALAGRGSPPVVVFGEAGVGKTRLLQEIRARLPASVGGRRLVAIEISGHESGREVPFAAAHPLFVALTELPSGAALRDLLAPRGASDGLEPVRVLEAVHRALDVLPAWALFVDDAQWLDPLTVALLHAIARLDHAHPVPGDGSGRHPRVRRQGSGGGGPCLVVAATRPGPHAGSLLAALRTSHPNEPLMIELTPLPADDALHLAQALVPGLEEAAARDIVVRSGGSPFWIERLCRAQAGGKSTEEELTAGLSARSTALLEAAALAGRPATVDELRDVLDWSPETIEASLAELDGRSLVVAAGGVVRIVHDIVAEAVRAATHPTTRSPVHRRWAERLERAPDDDVGTLSEALAHREAAEMPVADLALRLARSSRRRLLGTDGLARLASLAARQRPSDPGSVELHAAIARLAGELSQHELALERWALVADAATTPDDRAESAVHAARAAYQLRRTATARDWLARSRAETVAPPALAIAATALQAHIVNLLEHRAPEAWSLADGALGAARSAIQDAGGVDALDAPTREAVAEALRAATLAALQTYDSERMLDLARELGAVTRGADAQEHLESLVLVGMALRLLGRFRESEDTYRRAWEQATAEVIPSAALDAGFPLVRAMLEAGRLDQAAALVDELNALLSRTRDVGTWSRVVSRVAPYQVKLARGSWRAALDQLREAGSRMDDPHARFAFHAEVGTWLARLAPDEAQAVLAEVAAGRACTTEAGCPRNSGCARSAPGPGGVARRASRRAGPA